MDRACFQGFQRIAQERAGIHLREGKAVLVASRLGPRLRALGLSTEQEYLDLLRNARDDRELVRFLDAISTNFTKFYREADHFTLLSADATRARAGGQTRFRYWSAGCSSGEEPYTLAMVLDPLLGGCDWRILATDLSTAVLARAAAGEYGAEEIATIPAPQRNRHLVRRADGRWQFSAAIRERIVFRRMNLAERPFPMKGPLDAVLCRNVMIYFDLPMRERLVGEIERLLAPGAPLLIGHAETLSGIKTGLRGEAPSVYRRPRGGP